jgi:hypothetical protein
MGSNGSIPTGTDQAPVVKTGIVLITEYVSHRLRGILGLVVRCSMLTALVHQLSSLAVDMTALAVPTVQMILVNLAVEATTPAIAHVLTLSHSLCRLLA